MNCPKCRAPLEPHQVTPQTTVDACPRCFGVFYDKGELAVPLKLEALADSSLACPRCDARLKVGQTAGGKLVLDHCGSCGGLWFDVGEIQALRRLAGVEQVASGGATQSPAATEPPAAPLAAPASAKAAADEPRRPARSGSKPQPTDMSQESNPDADANPSFVYEGVRYAHFQTSIPVTTHVLGEFPWLAAAGDRVRARDFIAPPFMLTNEISEGEATWSRGEYVSQEEVWAAFGPQGSRAPQPRGVAAAQPNPWQDAFSAMRRAFFLGAAAVVAMAFLAGSASDGRQVFSQSWDFMNTDPDKSRVSEVFELGGRTSNVEVALHATVDNAWAYCNMALIEADTDVAYDFGAEVSYYHGVDDGESWSEGKPYTSVIVPSVPPGRYYLRVETEAYSLPTRVTVTLRRDVMLWRMPVIVWLLLALPLLYAWMRREVFENERWMESDHPRVSESGDGEDDE